MLDRDQRTPTDDPVSVMRQALSRTAVLAAEPVVLLAEGPAPDVTLFELVRFAALDGKTLREATISMLGAIASANLALVLWIKGDGVRLRLFIGRLDNDGNPAESALVERVVRGFWQGTHVRAIPKQGDATRSLTASLAQRTCTALIAGIPSERRGAPQDTRLDEALDALAKTSFDVVIQARPVADRDLTIAENNLIAVVEFAREVGKSTITETESYNESFAHAVAQSASVTETESLTSSRSVSTSRSTTDARSAEIGTVVGSVVGGAVGFVGGPAGVAVGARLGGAIGRGIGTAAHPPIQRDRQTAEGTTSSSSRARAANDSSTSTHQDSASTGRQITYESVSRNAELLATIGEEHRERLQKGRGVGMWQTSVRIAADDGVTADHVAHMLIGALRGDSSHLGPMVRLTFEDRAASKRIIASFGEITSARAAHQILPQGEQPHTWLTTDELAFYLRPPSTQVATLDVRLPVHFARHLPPRRARKADAIELGPLIANEREVGSVELSLSDLCRHTFIAGTTGSGKTTTIRTILRQLAEREIPFLVLEPAKSEYRELFDELESRGKRPVRIVVGKPSSPKEQRLVINPFMAAPGIPIGRHLEAIKTLVLGSFDLPEGLPQAMERLIFRAFRRFALESAIDAGQPSLGYPTFATLVGRRSLRKSLIDETVDELGYDPRVSANYKAALRLRLESFQRGVKSLLFGSNELDFSDLLTRPTFIELSDLTEPDVRRFVLATLVLRIYGEREGHARRLRRAGSPIEGDLAHVLVLEEAHHFLREVAGVRNELASHSIGLLADAFAELRSYGQAILVADQAPSELSAAVLRNTSTKIIHTLFHEADCAAVGNAMGIEEFQRRELRRLRPGEAIVQTPDLNVPVLCRVERGGA